MKRRILSSILLIFIAAFLLVSCDTITDPDPVPDTTPSTNYTLVWADEFDGASSTPDPTNWNYDLGYGYGNNNDGWGNDEWQKYTDSEENVRVEDGNLVITATWDSTNYIVPGKRDGSITSGRINTKNNFSMKYGKIQARIKPPQGAGMWPAFWLLGANYDEVSWPYCGEIDIMEMSPLYHDEKTSICTIHWWDEDENAHLSFQGTKVFNEALANDFHIFEIEWDASRIIGRIDDMTYMTRVLDPDTMDEFMNHFFIIMNIAVGGGYGGAPNNTTPWPQKMYIDWIRAYQKDVSNDDVETFGIFTDTTPVDDRITPGLDAEIYVWENTLLAGGMLPYEGDNVMSWATTGIGWFGMGIQANQPLDLSGFAGGNMNLMIKMPAEVSFQSASTTPTATKVMSTSPPTKRLTDWPETASGDGRRSRSRRSGATLT